LPSNDGETRRSLDLLKECGYNEGFCQLMVTHKITGIIGDERDLTRRKKMFGRNFVAIPSITSFWDLLAR